MPLVIAPLNVELTILKLLVDDRVRRHLESLGIAVNSKIEVVKTTGGSVICKIYDTRLALDNNIATKIIVK